VNRFRGFLVPRPDWIKVLFIRNTRTSSSINENSEIFSKISKKFKIFKEIQNFHKTCSHHVNLCCSLLSQKNQTLMNDSGQYSDL
jgi:hypothetical protein